MIYGPIGIHPQIQNPRSKKNYIIMNCYFLVFIWVIPGDLGERRGSRCHMSDFRNPHVAYISHVPFATNHFVPFDFEKSHVTMTVTFTIYKVH